MCILALGSGERLLYPSNRVRTSNPVSVTVRVMVSASLSSAAVESMVLIKSNTMNRFIGLKCGMWNAKNRQGYLAVNKCRKQLRVNG